MEKVIHKNKIVARDVHAPINQNCQFNYYIGKDDPSLNYVFTVPVDTYPTSSFIGREHELGILRKHIESGDKLVLVSGIGGIGKTHLCRYLFRDYLRNLRNNEEREIGLLGFMVYRDSMDETLLNSLKFSKTNNRDEDINAAWIYIDELALNKKIVLFIDNVYKTPNEDQSLNKLFTLNCSIIITSRKREYERFIPFELGCLSKEECEQLFETIYGRIKPEDLVVVDNIIEVLSIRHTKTIEIIAKLAKSKNWDIVELQQNLISKKFNLSLIIDGKNVNIQSEYKKLFDLANLSKSEVNILEAFSLFSPLSLPKEYCHIWMDRDAKVTEENGIYNLLYLGGWLEKNETGYYMHPIIAETIRNNAKAIKVGAHKNLLYCSIRMIDNEEYSSIYREMVQYVNALIENLWNDNKDKLFRIANIIGHCYATLYDFDKAIEWEKRALSLLDFKKKKHIPNGIILSNKVGQLYYKKGIYAEAFKWHKRALKLCAKLTQKREANIANTIEDMAHVYVAKSEYRKGKTLLDIASSIKKEIYGENTLPLTEIYDLEANINVFNGDYEAAINNLNKVLNIYKNIYGKYHQEISHVYNNLAAIYRSKGDYNRAQILFYKALIINRKILEEDHLEIGINYNNIALIYYYQLKLDKALEYHFKALEIKVKNLGDTHPFTATTMNNIGLVYDAIPDYDNAIEWLENALKIREIVFGSNHELTIETNMNIASVYTKKGDYNTALYYIQDARDACKMIYPENHLVYVVLRQILARIYIGKREYNRALDYLNEAVRIIEQLPSKDHPKFGEVYICLSLIYTEWEDYKKAARWAIEAYDLAKSKYGVEHPNTRASLENAIGIFAALGKSVKDCLKFIDSPIRNFSML